MRYMKSIIYFLLCIISFRAVGQDSTIVKRWGYYTVREILASHNAFYIDTGLNRYTGGWTADINGNTFELSLLKQVFNLKTDADPVLCQIVEGTLIIRSKDAGLSKSRRNVSISAGFQDSGARLLLTGKIPPDNPDCLMCPEYVKYEAMLSGENLTLTWMKVEEEGYYRELPEYLPASFVLRRKYPLTSRQ